MEKKKGKYNKNKQRSPLYYGIHLEIEEEKKLIEAVKNSIEIINLNYKLSAEINTIREDVEYVFQK